MSVPCPCLECSTTSTGVSAVWPTFLNSACGSSPATSNLSLTQQPSGDRPRSVQTPGGCVPPQARPCPFTYPVSPRRCLCVPSAARMRSRAGHEPSRRSPNLISHRGSAIVSDHAQKASVGVIPLMFPRIQNSPSSSHRIRLSKIVPRSPCSALLLG